MKVSVCLITYNHERYIAQAIESVLMQQVSFDYEIVIGEDCSTDGTRKIVSDYASRYPDRIRLLLHDRNLGPDRNAAVTRRACQGEYQAWLDGDDYWTSPHKLQKQADFLDGHAECAMCFHNVRVFRDDGRGEPYDSNPSNQKGIFTLEDLWTVCFIESSSVMFRRAVSSAVPDRLLIEMPSDWAAFILIARHGKIGYINELMGAYRIHGGGVWSRLNRTQQWEERVEFYKRTNAALDFQYDKAIRNHLTYAYYRLAGEYEKQGDLCRAAACLRECIHEPSTRLEEYLGALGLGGPTAQKIVRRRLWLCSHPALYRLVTAGQSIAEQMKKLGMAARTVGRLALGKSSGFITAHPNPIRVPGGQDFGHPVTRLSWTSARTDTVEVHVGAPDGPLFSRSGPSGSQTTAGWVRDGTVFCLQDVSGGLALTRANTLAMVSVRVSSDR